MKIKPTLSPDQNQLALFAEDNSAAGSPEPRVIPPPPPPPVQVRAKPGREKPRAIAAKPGVPAVVRPVVAPPAVTKNVAAEALARKRAGDRLAQQKRRRQLKQRSMGRLEACVPVKLLRRVRTHVATLPKTERARFVADALEQALRPKV